VCSQDAQLCLTAVTSCSVNCVPSYVLYRHLLHRRIRVPEQQFII